MTSYYPQGSGFQPHQPYQPQGTPPELIPQEDRTAASLAHAATLVSMVVSGGWLSFVGPLLIWILYKDRSAYVRRAAAGAFNFNIGANVMMIVGWLLVFSVIGMPLGIILMVVSGVAQVWCHVRATMRSLNGRDYHYPFQLRILG